MPNPNKIKQFMQGSPTLTSGLVAYWPLNEASGTRSAFWGEDNLTENGGTIARAAGKFGYAADFNSASSQYLSVTDNVRISAGDITLTMACWVNLDLKASNRVLIGKWLGTDKEYRLLYDSTADRFQFAVRNTANTADTTVNADTLGIPATGTWYFIVCWHDPAADTVNIQVNGGTVNSTATTGGVRDSANALRLGADGDGSYLDGKLQHVAIWKRVLTSSERSDLYNSGNGTAMEEIDFAADFPDLLPHGGRGIQTFEKIAETSLTNDTTTSFDFSSISSKYRHLMLQVSARSAATTGTNRFGGVRFNNDSGSNYDNASYRVDAAATLSAAGPDGPGVDAINVGTFPVDTGPANSFGAVTVWVPDYSNTARHKSLVGFGGHVEGTADTTGQNTSQGAGRWRNTAAINRFYFHVGGVAMKSGSRATLYGLRTHKFLVDQNDTLVENLVAYWNLNETSGTRADSWGANNLSQTGGVTSNPGRYGIAGQFTAASSQYLSIADNADLSTGDIDFTVAGWFYFDTTPNIRPFEKGNTAGQREYFLYMDGPNDKLQFYVSSTGSNQSFVQADNAGALSTGTWYFVVVWHDASANTINIQVNNGTPNSSSYSLGVYDGTGPFYIGQGESLDYMDGRIDEVAFWKKVLTAQERSDLYNNGYGNTLVKLGSK